jgi:hypothetical protein
MASSFLRIGDFMYELINDPADFDIWAKVDKNALISVVDWVSKQKSASRLEVLRAISPSIKKDKYIQVYGGYGWNELPKLLNSLPSFIENGSAVMTEQDCSPDYNVDYCKTHNLYHRPSQCPICIGNYIHEGHRK